MESIEHFHVISFKEKPNAEVACQYLESGRHLWNSGMFVWTTDAIFSELTEGIHAKVIWCNRALTQKHNICYEVGVEYFS